RRLVRLGGDVLDILFGLFRLFGRPRLFWHAWASGGTVASRMPVPTIEFRDVSFQRDGGPRVLGGFSLALGEGEVLTLVGRSGAGKSTILKLVNRLLEPDAGAVLVEGRDTRQWDPVRLRRRVGYVLQDVGLFPHMTVEDNIAVLPKLEAWPDERTARRVHEL